MLIDSSSSRTYSCIPILEFSQCVVLVWGGSNRILILCWVECMWPWDIDLTSVSAYNSLLSKSQGKSCHCRYNNCCSCSFVLSITKFWFLMSFAMPVQHRHTQTQAGCVYKCQVSLEFIYQYLKLFNAITFFAQSHSILWVHIHWAVSILYW